MNEMENIELKDRIRGSLFGGAVGDALGYEIEFCGEREIFRRYGGQGITAYARNGRGKAEISDDTQMSLFTANGLLYGKTKNLLNGENEAPRRSAALAYRDWYRTQYPQGNRNGESGICWLLEVPELYSRRAPGGTCLSALRERKAGSDDYIAAKCNHSKGCGGIMRTAPLAMLYHPKDDRALEAMDLEAAQLAAITHGHSLGYMPSAVLNHILCRILNGEGETDLPAAVREAEAAVSRLFEGDRHLSELTRIIDLALELAENEDTDLNNIHRLGEGWVAEETLGIALYCALRHADDFDAAMIAAVNHKGDSDSTGAVTGNIVGALAGYDAIGGKWKKDLELADVLLELADDLYHGSEMGEALPENAEWARKYVECRRARN